MLATDAVVNAAGLSSASAAPACPFPEMLAGYRLLRVIGEGGMGRVFEAEEAHPRRKVALKLIRAGFTSPSMLRRFEHEADLLARLEHPGIARIYHAGVADTGSGPEPYFVMEWIDGKRLDQYVRDANPSTEQRLQLLIRICEAVQHAHTKGVIHRDLKPSNILITPDGNPKVLDFGVARATDSDIRGVTLHTESGQIVGTLPYMAPEQAAGKLRDLDTSSDVYSLGVIAYELLVGCRPYSIEGQPLHDAVRLICEQEPSRLSSIDRSLRGDVETIVQKALEKEKIRRYQTAGELAADVQRYLDYEPITARPPSTWYQLSKFSRRHKLLVSGVAGIVCALAIAAGVSAAFAMKAERQRIEANRQAALAKDHAETSDAVRAFVVDMLSAADPDRQLGDKVTVLDAIHAAIKNLDSDEVREKPIIDSTLRTTIGGTLRTLSKYDEAEPLLRQAVKICCEKLPPNHSNTAEAMNNLATLLYERGRYAEAESYYRKVVDIRRHADPPDAKNVSEALSNLGAALIREGKITEAETCFREALALARPTFKLGEQSLPHALTNLSAALFMEGKYAEVEPLLLEGMAIEQKQLPPDHPTLAPGLNNLGALYNTMGRLDDAEKAFRKALRIRRAGYPAEHPLIAESATALAKLLKDQGRLSDAEPLYREALAIRRKAVGNTHPDTAQTMDGLATVLQAQGNFVEAEALFAEALTAYRKTYPSGDRLTGQVLNNIGMLMKDQGRLPEAESRLREALEIYRHVQPPGNPEIATSLSNLAIVLNAQGKIREALAAAAEAVELRRKSAGSPARLATTLFNHASILQSNGQLRSAEAAFKECLELRRKALPPQHADTVAAISSLATCLEAENKLIDAEPLHAESVTASTGKSAAAPARAALYLARYAACLARLGRQAAPDLTRQAYEQLKLTNQQDKPEFAQTVENLARAAEATGDAAQASRYRLELTRRPTQTAVTPSTSPTSATHGAVSPHPR
jgi:serine/threonine protein kinase/Tfp pilus assembly protein PilF